MPLETRVIEPIHVSRGTLPLDAQGSLAIAIPNELECVTNGTLANVIRQLSFLSRCAEDVFGGMIKETSNLIARTTVLQGRIDRLSIRVTQLDSAVEEVSIHDIHLKRPFKSNTAYDQQVMSRSTIPACLMEQYKCCDKPPPLSKLNQFREDGRDGLKFYTDPNYFFDLWRQEMLQITEREVRISKKGIAGHRQNSKSSTSSASNGMAIMPNASTGGLESGGPQSSSVVSLTTSSRNKKPRQPCNTRERYQMQAAQQEFLPTASNASMPPEPLYQQNGGLYHSPGAYGTMQHPHHQQQHRPNSLEISQYTEPPHGIHQHLPHHVQSSNRQSSVSSSSSLGHNAVPLMQQHPDYGYATGPPSHSSNYATTGAKIPIDASSSAYGGHPHHPLHSSPAPQPPHTPPSQSHHQHSNNGNGSSNAQLTPTRRGTGNQTPNHHRPSQPPPAPPSNPSSGSSSGQGTPTAGTPSRGNSRQASVNREILPPPPPPPPPPPMPPGTGFERMNGVTAADGVNRCSSSSDQSLPPPPPPQPLTHNNNIINNMTSKTNGQRISGQAPPPPPPMPGANEQNCGSGDRTDRGGGPAAMPSFAQQILAKQSQLQPTSNKKSGGGPRPAAHHVVNDERSVLLQAIRQGIKLRKVEDSKAREAEKAAPCNDVASILARRVPQELSDSDSDDHSGFESDAWEEDS